MVNSSFLDYRMPTSLDLPMIDTCIVEVDNPNHPYGVRGVGEVPIVPPMAAIANAIHDAIGVRLEVLPHEPRKRPRSPVGKRRKIASAKPLSLHGRGAGVRAKIYG